MTVHRLPLRAGHTRRTVLFDFFFVFVASHRLNAQTVRIDICHSIEVRIFIVSVSPNGKHSNIFRIESSFTFIAHQFHMNLGIINVFRGIAICVPVNAIAISSEETLN